ncbi:hypothetical protein ES708_10311 [subsurface metagenome]
MMLRIMPAPRIVMGRTVSPSPAIIPRKKDESTEKIIPQQMTLK